MRLFDCDNCRQLLFFENTRCTACGESIGYAVEAATLVSLKGGTGQASDSYEVHTPTGTQRFVKCKNFLEHDACNWLVLASEDQPYCRSCRLTEVIPDLSEAANRTAWLEMEAAKRRLIYTLYALNLPVLSKPESPREGLAFRFLRSTDEQKVMTGHADGIVTLNIAEADASFRENMREKLGEAYRTVLGHLRHESGHYYWDRIVRDSEALEPFRRLYGDERESYESAVQRHYDQGPRQNWSESFISAYATMHPWEDWAETWAHYMHMVDTLETAKSHGLAVRIPGPEAERAHVATDTLAFVDFENLMAGWHAVTIALNNLNRSMGVKDVYPFVLSPFVQDKLRFVHELIWERPAPSVGRNAHLLEASARPPAGAASARDTAATRGGLNRGG